MKVDLDDGGPAKFVNVFEGQRPEDIVQDISKTNNLNEKTKSKLLNLIRE